LIVWVIAGLLGMATGLRIGWALVNKQSVVSTAMIVALGSLALVAALNWEPLTLLLDTAAHWPNISIALSQVALTACAAGSCVMITAVSSAKKPAVTRRLAYANYIVAAVIAATSLVLFFLDGSQPEMAPQEYLRRNLGSSHTSLPWLLPLLYLLLVLTVVAWAGMRYSNRSRRGRALFVFTVGIGLIVLSSAFFFLRAVGTTQFASVGAAVTLLACAMAVVAAGSLLPTIEDWFGARRELRMIDPLLTELGRRQPNVGIGVRPRGPLAFRVAERMSLISDALFLEATQAAGGRAAAATANARSGDLAAPAARILAGVSSPPVAPREQARAVARWIGDAQGTAPFPGLGWLRQPSAYSDREWILTIAQQFRELERSGAAQASPDSSATLRRTLG
jgi:hypothetical protein